MNTFEQRKYPVHPFITAIMSHLEVKVVKKQVEVLCEKVAHLESRKVSDRSLQLGSIAFEFEKKALEATGGKFSDGRISTQGEKIYTYTIARLVGDYLDGDLDPTERTNFEAFLKRVSPNWSGSTKHLVKCLKASAETYKTGRIVTAHPKINSQYLKELEDEVNDLATFKIMTEYLKSVGKIQ